MELFELYGDSYPAKADLPAKRAEHAGEKPVSRTPKTVRQKPAGLLQGPLYFNPGLGVTASWEYEQRKLVTPHPAYEAVKAEYAPYGMTAEDPNLSAGRSAWTLFLDLGQFRIGRSFSGHKTITLLRDSYSPDDWEPNETVREVTAELDRQNYGWLGLSLLSFGDKEDPLYFSVWLNYGLDRYRFDIQDTKSLYHYDNETGYHPLFDSRTKLASGGGWGHNLALDLILTDSEGSPKTNYELAWSLSLRLGYNFGQFSDDASVWQSRFSGWTAGVVLGAEFSRGAKEQKTEECFEDYRMRSGKFCDIK